VQLLVMAEPRREAFRAVAVGTKDVGDEAECLTRFREQPAHGIRWFGRDGEEPRGSSRHVTDAIAAAGLNAAPGGNQSHVAYVVTNAVSMPQTPSEWLLARYDRVLRREFGPHVDRRRPRYDRGSNFDRRIFDVLDDHPGTACELNPRGQCSGWSGAASWPEAAPGDDLYLGLLDVADIA